MKAAEPLTACLLRMRRTIWAMLSDTELVQFFVSYVREHGTARGVRAAAAARWHVDRQTIGRWLADLRQKRKIGRGVYRVWRDGV